MRAPNDLLTPFHMDIAASIQAVLEEIVLRMTRSLAKQTGARNLCIAGGVGLNCVANGKILRDGHLKKYGFNPRRATPAALLARRFILITATKRTTEAYPRTGPPASWMGCRALTSAHPLRRKTLSAG